MNEWPLTNYGVAQIKKYSFIFLLIIASVFLVGNTITAFLVEKIEINNSSYIEKEGFLMFSNAEEYLNLIKTYPYDFGTELKIYKMRRGESFWNVAMRNKISVDTIIAANPFLDTLLAKGGTEIVIPADDGVIFAFDNIIDVWRMSSLLNYGKSIKGDYLHSVFRLFSLDDVRFAFFKGVKPEVVNTSLEKLFKLKKTYQSPVIGYYTSMYGSRMDPFRRHRSFHNGIDIKGKRGTPIYAANEGMVSYVGWRGRLGLTIYIQHKDGYETMYGHCQTLLVKKGDRVTRKDMIATLGSTGRSTGPHLHFTVKKHGKAMNPLLFIW